MLRGNPDISPADAALEGAPEALNRIGMHVATDVLALGVVNPLMAEAMNVEIAKRLAGVRMNTGAGLHLRRPCRR